MPELQVQPDQRALLALRAQTVQMEQQALQDQRALQDLAALTVQMEQQDQRALQDRQDRQDRLELPGMDLQAEATPPQLALLHSLLMMG